MARTTWEKVGLALPLVLVGCSLWLVLEGWREGDGIRYDWVVIALVAAIMFVMRWRSPPDS